MCGIFGIISPRENINITKAMRSAYLIKSRGPDNFDFVQSEKYYFAHSRLSIIDNSSLSNQPMWDKTNRYLIIFNGEIYNYTQIRKHLKQIGINFKTSSDTEVLLYSLITWGENALNKISGIFSFVFFDTNTGFSIAARDPMGVKPLFYARCDEQIIFSSSIIPIVTYNESYNTVSSKNIITYLSLRSTIGIDTLYKDIYKVAPGEIIKINNSYQRYRYVDVIKDYRRNPKTFDRNVVTRSVKNQLSNVPFSVLLSGGLDSSILGYELSNLLDNPISFVTASFSDNEYDETYYAKILSDYVGGNLTTVTVNPMPDIDYLSNLTEKKQSPIAMHNEVGMYELAKEVSKTSKVMYCGEGADELFSGYGRIFRLPFDMNRAQIYSNDPEYKAKLGLTDIISSDFISSFIKRYSYYDIDLMFSDILSNDLKKYVLDIKDCIHTKFTSITNRSPINNYESFISCIFVDHHLPSLLEMIDSLSMSNGVEARVPFTDKSLVKTALAMDEKYKLKWKSNYDYKISMASPISVFSGVNDISKYPLRKSYKGHLPNEIISRPKMGFPSPLGRWSASESIMDIIEMFYNNSAALSSLVDGKKIKNWYKTNIGKNDTFGKKLWMIINLEIYLQGISGLPSPSIK